MVSHWRDCEEWKKQGLELSTCSNEAAKLFDVAVTQYIGFYEDEQFGGFEGTFTSLQKADPEFVMGYVVHNGLQLISMSTTIDKNVALQQRLTYMEQLASKQSLKPFEQLHVKAIKRLADGYLDEACSVWEKILLNHPHDVLALRLVQDGYYHLGQPFQIRDCIARILPEWNTSMQHYGYLFGMYSFGLCETGNYELADKNARKSLEINHKDFWGIHALAHVLEMTGQPEEGLQFLETTVDNWQHRSTMACHLNWHSAIYHIEKGDYMAALNLFDDLIASSAKKNEGAFNIADASSLLYRLSLEGCDVGNRWQEVLTPSHHHMDDHLSTFYDIHYLLTFLGGKQNQLVNEFIESSKKFISVGCGSNHRVMKLVGEQLFDALVAYDSGNFELAVDTFLPIRYALTEQVLSGSRAQKDLIMQVIIHACLKSSNHEHVILARRLLAERKALKENSMLTDRLIVLSSHK